LKTLVKKVKEASEKRKKNKRGPGTVFNSCGFKSSKQAEISGCSGLSNAIMG
jgi:hypothetical protein